ncbi:hypothetical protein FB451DRAFT_707921 [Mycena latifolia]|nr:hypothetical protein FB451DRAFT_707921 [Mycena latifolia]
MTTGRINQVTTFLKPAQQLRGSKQRPLLATARTDVALGAGSVSLTRYCDRFNRNDEELSQRYSLVKANGRNTLFPDLTNFEHASPGHSQATRMAALRENYQQPAEVTKTTAQSRRIPKWLNASGLAIGK